ncbi:MAG TPA: DUF4870 domain-containing protein [Candidatus Obscuribacterales bacterium]|jgi:uncharacterized Tic20 family protein
MYDTDKRKLLSAVAHASIFFSAALVSIGVPIAILFVSDDPVVKENAREAINFHLNIWLWGVIIGILSWILIGLLLVPFYFLAHWGLAVWAIASSLSNSDHAFRYPFIFRLF